MKTRSILVTAALLCLAIGLPGSTALAQQKQRVSVKVASENNKNIVSQNVDVGDVPNHIVRLFDARFSLPNNAPSINGLRLVEIFARGIADLANGNGSGTGYLVFVAENGDKFFSRNAILANTASLTATWVGQITGGTGRFGGIQGLTRQVLSFDLRPGGAGGDSQFDIEYSIGN